MAKNSFVKVGAIHVHLEDVLLPMGLMLGSVDIEGSDVHVESHPFSVTMTKRAHFQAKLRVNDLASFLNEKGPADLKNFRVQTKDGHLQVDASKMIFPVKAICRLKIHQHTQIFVEAISIEVMGSGVTNALQSTIEKINPVLDADDFPVDAIFEHISIENGEVLVKGKMAPRG
jgi:hypothetical protein